MTGARPRPEYVGGRLAIADALRHAARALRELGDGDLAGEVERTADAVVQRGALRDRDAEITREFPIIDPPKET